MIADEFGSGLTSAAACRRPQPPPVKADRTHSGLLLAQTPGQPTSDRP